MQLKKNHNDGIDELRGIAILPVLVLVLHFHLAYRRSISRWRRFGFPIGSKLWLEMATTASRCFYRVFFRSRPL